MHRAAAVIQQGAAERLPGGAKAMALTNFPSPDRKRARMWFSPTGSAKPSVCAGSASTGSGLPAPKGPARASISTSADVDAAGADRAVDQQRAVAPRRFDRRRQRLFEKGAKRAERVLAQRDAGRHGVAAALEQQPFAHRAAAPRWPRSTPGIERPEPVPMPPGSSAMAKAGRPKRSLSRAATRPTTPGCQPSPAVTTTAPFSSRPSAAMASASACASGRKLDLPALAVEPVELGGDARGFARIVLQQQPHAEIGAADAAAGIDARPEQEAEMPGLGRPGQPRHVHQRGQRRHCRGGAARSAPWRRRRG